MKHTTIRCLKRISLLCILIFQIIVGFSQKVVTNNEMMYIETIKFVLNDSLDLKYRWLAEEQSKYGNITILMDDLQSNLPAKIYNFDILYGNENDACEVLKRTGNKKALYISSININHENIIYVYSMLFRYKKTRKGCFSTYLTGGELFGAPKKAYVIFTYDIEKKGWILQK